MWKNQRIYILGAGKSGIAAAEYLAEQGAAVWLNDEKNKDAFDPCTLEKLAAKGVILDLGRTADPLSIKADLIMQSPGYPADKPVLLEAAAAGIPVVSEIELGYLATKASIMGITGSNGKTTTTSLLGEIMKKAFSNVFVGGNIGTPFISEAGKLAAEDWAVLELSSFQLETIRSFRPKIGLILNMTPDHLDRHKTFENYCEAKWRIAEFQDASDWLVLNYDDPMIRQWAEEKTSVKSRKLFFSRKTELSEGVWVDGRGMIMVSLLGEQTPVMATTDIRIPGAHNLENVLAAVGAAFAAGVKPEQIAQAIREFKGVAHRIEPVEEIHGVLYVNDSKATNTDAAIKAMDSFSRPILLIAGGLGKGGSYYDMIEKVKEKVKWLVLIGDDADKIEAAALEQGYQRIQRAGSLAEAVDFCASHASSGDVVLLSPACASYDMFKNYGHRGDAFKELVRALPGVKA
jgi:UDP-N-acetylmuramoylalanine--D-glutamate ligase